MSYYSKCVYKDRHFEVVVPEKLFNVLFFRAENDETDGILCKVFMDESLKPCNFGLGMEAL